MIRTKQEVQHHCCLFFSVKAGESKKQVRNLSENTLYLCRCASEKKHSSVSVLRFEHLFTFNYSQTGFYLFEIHTHWWKSSFWKNHHTSFSTVHFIYKYSRVLPSQSNQLFLKTKKKTYFLLFLRKQCAMLQCSLLCLPCRGSCHPELL